MGRCLFNGQPSGLSLTDFIGKYQSEFRSNAFHNPKYDRRAAFSFLGKYLGGDPLKLYNREFDRIWALTETIPGVEGRPAVPEQKEVQGRPATETQTMVPYVPYRAAIPAIVPVPAQEISLRDPLQVFFNLLKEQYRLQYPAQAVELKCFTKKPGETAQQMYSRLQDLMEAVPDLVTPQEAALLYLGQFPFHEKRALQREALSRFGHRFTLDQVAPIAIRAEVDFAYLDSSDPTSRVFKSASARPDAKPGVAGTSSNPPPRVQVTKQEKGKSASSATPAPTAQAPRPCHRCGETGHWANRCPLPPHKLVCTHCTSQGKSGQGHVEKSCFLLHPHLRPPRSAGQGSGKPFAASAGPANPTSNPSAPPAAPNPLVSGSGGLSEEQFQRLLVKLEQVQVAKLARQDDYEYGSCALVGAAAAPAASTRQLRPAAVRQLPQRYRELPAEADHNRVGRPRLNVYP